MFAATLDWWVSLLNSCYVDIPQHKDISIHVNSIVYAWKKREPRAEACMLTSARPFFQPYRQTLELPNVLLLLWTIKKCSAHTCWGNSCNSEDSSLCKCLMTVLTSTVLGEQTYSGFWEEFFLSPFSCLTCPMNSRYSNTAKN